MIPDIISISVINGEWQFIISDAKYYNAKLEPDNPPKAQPGIESVTKQYLYQLAYQEFINEHNFSAVKNCFLLPTEKDVVVDKKEVSLQMLSKLSLQSIKVRLIPAKTVFDNYLSGRKMDFSLLRL